MISLYATGARSSTDGRKTGGRWVPGGKELHVHTLIYETFSCAAGSEKSGRLPAEIPERGRPKSERLPAEKFPSDWGVVDRDFDSDTSDLADLLNDLEDGR